MVTADYSESRVRTSAYLSDFNLDRSVVLGDNEAVGGGALSWNVLFLDFTLFVDHLGGELLAIK